MNQISVDKEHKYYHPNHIWCTVYLNNVRQYLCITADADEGWLEKYKTDSQGRFIESALGLERETLHGDVRIEQREPTPGWKAPNGDF